MSSCKNEYPETQTAIKQNVESSKHRAESGKRNLSLFYWKMVDALAFRLQRGASPAQLDCAKSFGWVWWSWLNYRLIQRDGRKCLKLVEHFYDVAELLPFFSARAMLVEGSYGCRRTFKFVCVLRLLLLQRKLEILTFFLFFCRMLQSEHQPTTLFWFICSFLYLIGEILHSIKSVQGVSKGFRSGCIRKNLNAPYDPRSHSRKYSGIHKGPWIAKKSSKISTSGGGMGSVPVLAKLKMGNADTRAKERNS